MSSPVQGKDVVLQISSDSGTTFKSLICEISNGFSATRETNSITTKCDDGTTTRSLGAYSWEMTADAVADTAPTALTQVSYLDVLALFTAGTLLTVKIAATGDYFHSGTAYITSLELTNEVNGVSEFSLTLSGSGALDVTE
jgi:TP901-1 family phage major tail protein